MSITGGTEKSHDRYAEDGASSDPPTTMGRVPEQVSPIARVTSDVDGDLLLLTVAGPLDVTAGRALVAAVADAVRDSVDRLEIDLCGITGFDDDGAAALLACRDVGTPLAGGLHYRTCSGGAGHEALLRAYSEPGGER